MGIWYALKARRRSLVTALGAKHIYIYSVYSYMDPLGGLCLISRCVLAEEWCRPVSSARDWFTESEIEGEGHNTIPTILWPVGLEIGG